METAFTRAPSVYDLALETPLHRAASLSLRLGVDIWLKREDRQPGFSFKIRGAYNCIAHLPAAERARGIVAASAGNHAQGVARSATHLGVGATIVMPRTTPGIKVDAVRALGARVRLVGDQYADAEVEARRLAADSGAPFVHAYDDPLVIAGHATIGEEILRQCRTTLAAVFVPVGGGGLIAGIASHIKSRHPGVRVFGVEPTGSDAMCRALAAGRPVPVEHPDLFADGVAVRQVGVHTFRIAQQCVDGVFRVGNDQICAAIRDIFHDTRAIAEPAGALAVAGIKAYLKNGGDCKGAIVGVVSGANINFDRLPFVAARAALWAD